MADPPLKSVYETLLHAYWNRVDADAARLGTLVDEYAGLLEGYRGCRQRSDQLSTKQATNDHLTFTTLLRDYKTARNAYWATQSLTADDFNVLAVFGLRTNEVRHSMALAWLLDRDPENYGTHVQGPLGFRLFLREFANCGLSESYADFEYRVSREARGDDSIIDVEIVSQGQFIIHIENKIWASQGDQQCQREWVDLERRASLLNISQSHIHALYLTPYSVTLPHEAFCVITWRNVAKVFERFAAAAKPDAVCTFARHFADCLRSLTSKKETADVEAAAE